MIKWIIAHHLGWLPNFMIQKVLNLDIWGWRSRLLLCQKVYKRKININLSIKDRMIFDNDLDPDFKLFLLLNFTEPDYKFGKEIIELIKQVFDEDDFLYFRKYCIFKEKWFQKKDMRMRKLFFLRIKPTKDLKDWGAMNAWLAFFYNTFLDLKPENGLVEKNPMVEEIDERKILERLSFYDLLDLTENHIFPAHRETYIFDLLKNRANTFKFLSPGKIKSVKIEGLKDSFVSLLLSRIANSSEKADIVFKVCAFGHIRISYNGFNLFMSTADHFEWLFYQCSNWEIFRYLLK